MKVLRSCAILLLVASSSLGGTIYVDASNGCPGSGTSADPYCSIQLAINAAVSQDLILVRPGT